MQSSSSSNCFFVFFFGVLIFNLFFSAYLFFILSSIFFIIYLSSSSLPSLSIFWTNLEDFLFNPLFFILALLPIFSESEGPWPPHGLSLPPSCPWLFSICPNLAVPFLLLLVAIVLFWMLDAYENWSESSFSILSSAFTFSIRTADYCFP